MTQETYKHKKGDHVVYNKRGVYHIEDIRKEKIAGEIKLYYVLRSVYDKNSSVYIPMDNEELVGKLEKVLSKDEIEVIIENSHKAEIEYPKELAIRQEYYDEIFSSGDLSRVIALMKNIKEIKEQAQLTKSRFSALDERTLAGCQKVLCEAFAFTLGLSQSEIIEYIYER